MITRRRRLLVAIPVFFSGLLTVGVGIVIHFKTTLSFESAWAARQKSDDSVAKKLIASRANDPAFRDFKLLLESGLLVRQGRPVDAAKKLQRLSPECRERPECQQIRGEVLYGLGELRDAEMQFLSVLRNNPSRSDVHLWLGVIYYDQMQFDRFFREMDRTLRLDPNDYRPHRLMGFVHHRFLNFSDSARHFQDALRLGGISGQKDVIGPLAQALLFNRDYASVVELITTIPERSGEMWAMLAEAHLNLGDSEELVNQCVEEALKAGPHERRVLQFASQRFIDNGRVEEAIAYLNEILEKAPHYERAHYLLSRAYLKLGRKEDYELAIKRLKAAEEIKKKHDELMQRIVKQPNDVESLKQAQHLATEMGEPELAKLYAVARASGLSQNAPSH